MLRAYDCGYTKFARNDCRVRCARAGFGDDGGRDLHDRLPIGVRGAGNENLTFFKSCDVSGRDNDTRCAGGDAVAHGATSREFFAVFFPHVFFHF